MNFKAMTAAAMVLALAVMVIPAAVFTEDVSADDTSGNTYNVALYEGQVYSYTPSYSLSGVTTTLSGTAVSAFSMTVSNGTISGTAPTISTSGGSQTYDLDICASTTKPTQEAHQYVHFTVYDTLTITGPSSKTTFVGDAVEVNMGSNFEGSGATYSATDLPSGLSINSSTGVISGTVGGSAGTFTSTVTVEHTASGQISVAGKAQSMTVTFDVSAVITANGSDGTLTMYVINGSVVTTDFTDPNYYKLISNLGNKASFSGSLIGLTGLNLNSDGTITGTPTFMGEKSATVTVADSDNPTNTTSVTLTVEAVAKLSFSSTPTGGIIALGV
jgi:hypothetical protein